MRLESNRVARVVLIAAPAVGFFWMLRDPSWERGRELLYAVSGAAALLGLLARALDARGYVRTAKGLGLAVAAGAIALAVYRSEAGDWIDAVAAVVSEAGPLAVAIYALRSTRDTAGFALGAALLAIASWSFWPVPALAVLGFVVGRDALGGAETTARHAHSQVGAGALCIVMVSAIRFDLVALLVDAFRPETLLSRVHVDGAGTYVPRLVVEALFVVACLGHARGRSWGVLALAVLVPVLVCLLGVTYRLPMMGAGCLAFTHPLDASSIEEIGRLGIVVALAVVPWIGPFVRAARSTSGTRA